jgi:type IV fimbrial biogenesis protein FimT
MRRSGLTLVELLIALAIAAVLMAAAAPSFRSLAAARRSDSALNHLIAAVHYARSAAITSRTTVTLCPGSGNACLGRDQWHHGALVFADDDADGVLDPGETVLTRLPPLEPGDRIYWRSFRNRTFLQFRPSGYTIWQNGHFLYCPADGHPARARMIILNAQGRVRVARDQDGDGVAEDAQGRPLTCP